MQDFGSSDGLVARALSPLSGPILTQEGPVEKLKPEPGSFPPLRFNLLFCCGSALRGDTFAGAPTPDERGDFRVLFLGSLERLF